MYSEVHTESQANKMLHGSIGLSGLCLSQVLAAIVGRRNINAQGVHRALLPGGRFVVDCGGAGNVVSVRPTTLEQRGQAD